MLAKLRQIQSHPHPTPPLTQKINDLRAGTSTTVTPLHKQRTLKHIQQPSSTDLSIALQQIQQRQSCQHSEKGNQTGTLASFLQESPTSKKKKKYGRRNTAHLHDLRQRTQEATEAAQKAAGLRTRAEQQTTSMNVAAFGSRLAKKTKRRVQRKKANMSKIFQQRRQKILRRREKEMAEAQMKKGNHHIGSVTSTGLANAQMKDHAYQKKKRIANAKHKLKGFARALMLSTGNLKFYFAQNDRKKDPDVQDQDSDQDSDQDPENTHDQELNNGDDEAKLTTAIDRVLVEKNNKSMSNSSTLTEREIERQKVFSKACARRGILPEHILLFQEPKNEKHQERRANNKGINPVRTILRLSHRSLSNNLVAALGTCLSNDELQQLYVDDNCMLEEGLSILCASQMNSPVLTHFDVSENVLEKYLPEIRISSNTETHKNDDDDDDDEDDGDDNDDYDNDDEDNNNDDDDGAINALQKEDRQRTIKQWRNPGTMALKRLIGSRNCRLLSLRLSDMRLGDLRGSQLGPALSASPNLRLLDVSHNQLSKKTILSLHIFPCLESLNLSWNQIGGGVALQHLLNCVCIGTETLLELNLGGNSIGTWSHSHQRKQGILALCDYLHHENNTLRHLDLGRNMLSEEHGAQMDAALNANRSLLGIHCEGNKFRVNSLGRIVPTSSRLDQSHNQKQNIHDHDHEKNVNDVICQEEGFHDCCLWCGRWSWVRLHWENGACGFLTNVNSSGILNNSLCVHLSSDGWSAVENEHVRKMKRVLDPVTTNEDANEEIDDQDNVIGWSIEVAVPSGTPLHYYFSWKGKTILSNVQPVVVHDNMKVHVLMPTATATTGEGEATTLFYPRDVVPRGNGWHGSTQTAEEQEESEKEALLHPPHYIHEAHCKRKWKRKEIDNELQNCTFAAEVHANQHLTILEEQEEELHIKQWFAEKFVLFERLFSWCVAPHHRLDRVGFEDMLKKSKLIVMYRKYENKRQQEEKMKQEKMKQEKVNQEKVSQENNEHTESTEEVSTPSLKGTFKSSMGRAMRHISMVAGKGGANVKKITIEEGKFHMCYDRASEQHLLRERKRKFQKQQNEENTKRNIKRKSRITKKRQTLLNIRNNTSTTTVKKNPQHITASMLRDQHSRLRHLENRGSNISGTNGKAVIGANLNHTHHKGHAKHHRNIVHHASLNFDSFLHLYVHMAILVVNGDDHSAQEGSEDESEDESHKSDKSDKSEDEDENKNENKNKKKKKNDIMGKMGNRGGNMTYSVVECLEKVWQETFRLHMMYPLHYEAVDVQLALCWKTVIQPHLTSMEQLFDQYCDHPSEHTMTHLAITRLFDDLIGFTSDEDHGFKRHHQSHIHVRKGRNRRIEVNKKNKKKKCQEKKMEETGHIHIRDIYRYVMWRCSIQSVGILHLDTFIDVFLRLLCCIPMMSPMIDLNSIVERCNELEDDKLPLTYGTPRTNMLKAAALSPMTSSISLNCSHSWSLETRLRLLLAALFGTRAFAEHEKKAKYFQLHVLGSWKTKMNLQNVDTYVEENDEVAKWTLIAIIDDRKRKQKCIEEKKAAAKTIGEAPLPIVVPSINSRIIRSSNNDATQNTTAATKLVDLNAKIARMELQRKEQFSAESFADMPEEEQIQMRKQWSNVKKRMFKDRKVLLNELTQQKLKQATIMKEKIVACMLQVTNRQINACMFSNEATLLLRNLTSLLNETPGNILLWTEEVLKIVDETCHGLINIHSAMRSMVRLMESTFMDDDEGGSS